MTRYSATRDEQGPAGRAFIKMNGLGNDFVVLDARAAPVTITPAQARAIADRRSGIGCDQIIIMEPSERAHLAMRILNADGSVAGACGNATRCVARLVLDETGADAALLETAAGVLVGRDAGRWDHVTIDMGLPRLGWADIPLAHPVEDTAAVALHGIALPPGMPETFCAVNMGNPHAVFFVADVAAVPLGEIGPKIETHDVFPDRVNVSVAAMRNRDAIELRVWERGAGLTRACGTAACATAVAAVRLGLGARRVTIHLPGGSLAVALADDGHVHMAGAIEQEFEGVLERALFAPGSAATA